MSEKEMALAAADGVFKASAEKTFTVLGEALRAADATAKETALERARTGLALAQSVRAECIKLANSLP